jgi:hypothetical protein
LFWTARQVAFDQAFPEWDSVNIYDFNKKNGFIFNKIKVQGKRGNNCNPVSDRLRQQSRALEIQNSFPATAAISTVPLRARRQGFGAQF